MGFWDWAVRGLTDGGGGAEGAQEREGCECCHSIAHSATDLSHVRCKPSQHPSAPSDVNNGAVEEGTVLRSPTASEAFDITFSDNDTHGTNDRGTVEAGESPAAVSAGKPKASGDSPPVASVRKPDAGVPLGPGREENPEVSSADGPPDFWRQLQGSGMGGVGRGDRMGLANGYGQDRGPLADGAGGRDAVGVRSGELWRAEGSRSVGEMPGVAGRSISEAEGGHGALHSALHKASSSVQETLTINGRGGGASVQGRPRAGSAGAAVSEGRMRVTGRGRVGSVASSSDGRGSAVGRVVAAGGGSGGVTRSRPSRRLASAPTDGVADGAALFQAAIAGDINKVGRMWTIHGWESLLLWLLHLRDLWASEGGHTLGPGVARMPTRHPWHRWPRYMRSHVHAGQASGAAGRECGLAGPRASHHGRPLCGDGGQRGRAAVFGGGVPGARDHESQGRRQR